MAKKNEEKLQTILTAIPNYINKYKDMEPKFINWNGTTLYLWEYNLLVDANAIDNRGIFPDSFEYYALFVEAKEIYNKRQHWRKVQTPPVTAYE